MKFNTPLILVSRLLPVVFILWLLPGCMPAPPGLWKNNEIGESKRKEFNEITIQLFTAAKTGNLHDAQVYLSKELIDNRNTSRQLEIVGNYLKADGYKLFDQFYAVHKYKGMQTLKPDSGRLNSYVLNYEAITREMYFMMFLQQHGQSKKLITVAFAKYNYGWKVANLMLGQYTVLGKTAPDFYALIKQQDEKGYFLDADNNLDLMRQVEHPNDFWNYQNEEEMEDLFRKIALQTREKLALPFDVKQLPGRPHIFRLFSQPFADGAYPAIYYTTKINIKDTTAIKKENVALQKVIGKIYPGINVGKKYILYTAFNQEPDGKKTVAYFDITEKLP